MELRSLNDDFSMRRRAQSCAERPSLCESIINGVPVDAKFAAKNGQAGTSISELVDPGATRVLILLKPRCPATIIRFVISVVVSSLNRHPWWTFSHILKKFSKVQPFLADLNAPAAVMRIPLIPWIKATGHHPFPGLPSFSKCPSIASFWRSSVAATGRTVSAKKTLFKNRLNGSTFTLTNHGGVPFSRRTKVRRTFRDDFKLSETISNDANFGRHSNGQFIVVFSDEPRLQTVLIVPSLSCFQPVYAN